MNHKKMQGIKIKVKLKQPRKIMMDSKIMDINPINKDIMIIDRIKLSLKFKKILIKITRIIT